MATISKSTVEARIQSGYAFNLGQYLTEGFQIFQKEWLKFSLYGLVSTLLILLAGMTLIGLPLVIYPIFLGYAIAADKVNKGEALEFNTFFEGFKNMGQHFIVAMLFFVAYLLMYVILLAFMFTSGFEEGMEGFQVLGIFGLFGTIGLFVLLIYALQVLLVFAPFLIHYGGFSAKEAIQMSIALAKKNFWWLLLFNFLVGIISGLGQYLCLIGLFASIPIAALIGYSMVKNILFTAEYEEIDEIGQKEF